MTSSAQTSGSSSGASSLLAGGASPANPAATESPASLPISPPFPPASSSSSPHPQPKPTHLFPPPQSSASSSPAQPTPASPEPPRSRSPNSQSRPSSRAQSRSRPNSPFHRPSKLLLPTSPGPTGPPSPTSSIRSSSAASIFERDIEPTHAIHSGFLGAREATDLGTAPVLDGAAEALAFDESGSGVEVLQTAPQPYAPEWGRSMSALGRSTSPTGSFADSSRSPALSARAFTPSPPPPGVPLSPVSLVGGAAAPPSTLGITSGFLPLSPPTSSSGSPPPLADAPLPPPALSPVPRHAHAHSPSRDDKSSTSSRRISFLSYGDVIAERPTSALPLNLAIQNPPPPQSAHSPLAPPHAHSHSPSPSMVDFLGKGLEARLGSLAVDGGAGSSAVSLSPSAPASPGSGAGGGTGSGAAGGGAGGGKRAEEMRLEESETVTERGAERELYSQLHHHLPPQPSQT